MTDVDGRMIEFGAVIPGLYAVGTWPPRPRTHVPGAGDPLPGPDLWLAGGPRRARTCPSPPPPRGDSDAPSPEPHPRGANVLPRSGDTPRLGVRGRNSTPSATLDYGTPGMTAVEANIDLLRAVSTLDVEVDPARDARRHRRFGRPGPPRPRPSPPLRPPRDRPPGPMSFMVYADSSAAARTAGGVKPYASSTTDCGFARPR